VQDIMVLHVVQNNYPERPMQFAVTVGDDNMMGLQKWVKMEGMVYTLVEEPANKAIDPLITAKLIDSVYRFRKLGDSTVYIDPNTEGLLTNYSATNFRMVMWAQDQIEAVDQKIEMAKQTANDSVVVNLDSLKSERANYMATAEKYLKFNAFILPREWRTHYYAAQLYMGAKEYGQAEASLKKGLDISDDPKPFLMNLVELYLQQNQVNKANELLGTLKSRFPKDFEVWYSLAEMYQRRGDFKTAKSLLSTWLEGNGAHQYAGVIEQTIQELTRREKAAVAPPPAPPKTDSAGPAEAAPQGKDTAKREGAPTPAKG
jgi:tetratricopeptide (TPR) repeat protein